MNDRKYRLRARLIIFSIFLVGLLAAPYLLVEYYIFKSKNSCSIRECTSASIEDISIADKISGYIYPKNSSKAIQIAHLKIDMLLALYKRVSAVRVNAVSMAYQLASGESNSRRASAQLLNAMRIANSLGEFSLARIIYAEANKDSSTFEFKGNISDYIRAEDTFAAIMELTPYLKKMYAGSKTVDVERLKIDISSNKIRHEDSIGVICKVKGVACNFVVARYEMLKCFIDFDLNFSPDKACMSRLVNKIESEGVYLTTSNISAACASKEMMSGCSDLAQMLEPYYGTFFGQYYN